MLTPARPAAAITIQGSGPAPLLNQLSLQGAVGPLYTATTAQQASLADLEHTAVANTLTDHGLPQSDAAAAQTWGRDAAEVELWALIVQAIETPADQRTTDQANAVAWLQHVTERQDITAAQDAGLEYTKWAGLGANAYESLLATNPTETQLQNFLSGAPEPYGIEPNGKLATENTPASTSNEGYCVYVPPAPDSSQYVNSVYGSATDQICAGKALCATCIGVPTPTEQQFVSWGAADANKAFNTGTWAAVANDVGEYGGFGAAVTAGVGAGLITTDTLTGSLSSLVVGSALSEALSPYGGVVAAGEVGLSAGSVELAESSAGIAAADIGGAVSIVLAAIAVGVIEGINVVSAAELPGTLANLISHAQAPKTPPDLPSILANKNAAGELYALFIGATLPQPALGTCDNSNLSLGSVNGSNPRPCLNQPAIPPLANTDPTFTVAGPGVAKVTSALAWKDVAQGTTNSAYITGHWFVQTMTAADNSSLTLQTLGIHYTDWNGNERVAWLTRDANAASGYEFITYRPDTSPPVDPSTCLANGNCSISKSIHYLTPAGLDYTAEVSFGRTAVSAVSGSGNYEGKPALTATLTTSGGPSGGTPLAGKAVTFYLDGTKVGSATTNSLGVATLTPDVTLSSSYTPGGYPGTVKAVFSDAAASPDYLGSSATGTLTVSPAPQTITFTTPPPASAAYGTTFTVAAKASSGFPVTYAGTGACSNTGATFTMTSGTGTCTVTVSQNGQNGPDESDFIIICPPVGPCTDEQDSLYTSVSATGPVTATKASQSITFDLSQLPKKTYGDPSFSVSSYASASSGLAVSFTSATPSVCTVSGSTVTLVAGGTCTLGASQGGNLNYQPAPQVKQSFNVADPDLKLTGTPPDKTVNATSPSGVTVTYTAPSAADEDKPAAATVSCSPASGTMFPIGTTTVTCTAKDGDDLNSPVTASFTVTVKGPLAQLQDLLTYAQHLRPGTSLSNQVQAAIDYYKAGDITDACGQLGALIHEARAQSGHHLTASQAQFIIDAANRIRAVLAC